MKSKRGCGAWTAEVNNIIGTTVCLVLGKLSMEVGTSDMRRCACMVEKERGETHLEKLGLNDPRRDGRDPQRDPHGPLPEGME